MSGSGVPRARRSPAPRSPAAIDAAQPEHFPPGVTYHPTFLYECLWNLVGFLIWLDHKRVLRPGRTFALYIGGYFTGRVKLPDDQLAKLLAQPRLGIVRSR